MPEIVPSPETNVLESLMKANPDFFDEIVSNRDSLRVQIIYTQINRDKNNLPSFIDYTFNVNNDQYFYPASTVKLPVALLSLEKLHELNVPGINRQTAMVTDSSYAGQQQVITHPVASDSKPSIEQYIREIFLVSDNDAFNRLYEFLGQQYINDKMHEKGYRDAEIIHRLNISLTEDENRHTNAVDFYDTSGTLLLHQPAAFNKKPYAERHTLLGNGYYKSGVLVNEPFDFSKKNRLHLSDLHNILRSVIFPSAVDEKQRFNLTEEELAFVRKSMSTYPRESAYPEYDTANYHDAYVKFLLYGSRKGSLPSHIRIFNKVGDAYGFLTDAAYIVDFENNVEFMLSATIFCNEKGIFNNDDYQYEQLGFPFMKNLGTVILDYELQRKRAFKPDLSPYKFQYDR